MLVLKDKIAYGRTRACYYHPKNPNLCVKVALKKKYEKLLKKDLENNQRFHEGIGLYVPTYYKLIQTNKGLGLVSDLIHDKKGLSARLADWVIEKRPVKKEIIKQFDDFFARVLKYRLWFYDFNSANFLIRYYNKHYHIFFVDTKSLNRNNSWSMLKLEYIFPFLAKRRILRRIYRFYEKYLNQKPKWLKDGKQHF